jgi:hypothetical protein
MSEEGDRVKQDVDDYAARRKAAGTWIEPKPEPPARPLPTLAQQVDQLACRCLVFEGIAGEMLATIKLNFERGYLVAQNDEGKLNLQKCIASWEQQLAQVDEVYPPQPLGELRKQAKGK